MFSDTGYHPGNIDTQHYFLLQTPFMKRFRSLQLTDEYFVLNIRRRTSEKQMRRFSSRLFAERISESISKSKYFPPV